MRKRRAEKRLLAPDPKFNDVLVARFVNSIQWSGKKTTARRILYQAMEEIEKRTKQDGYEVFKKALYNAQPMLEVRARRVAGHDGDHVAAGVDVERGRRRGAKKK